jgi:hypothetical protein
MATLAHVGGARPVLSMALVFAIACGATEIVPISQENPLGATSKKSFPLSSGSRLLG